MFKGLYPKATFTPGSVPISALANPGAGKVIGSAGGVAAAVTPPGGVIGYDEIQTLVVPTVATEAGTIIIPGSAYNFDGGLVCAEFFSPSVNPDNTAGAGIRVSLFEGAVQIGRLGSFCTDAVLFVVGTIFARYYFTPSAGVHTYTITARNFGNVGNGAIGGGTGGAAAFVPCYLRFTKAT